MARSRNFQLWKEKAKVEGELEKQKEDGLEGDAMAQLEDRTQAAGLRCVVLRCVAREQHNTTQN